MLGREKKERTGVHAERGVVMLVVIAVHRFDDADVIHLLSQMRKQIADQRSALAAGLKLPQWLQQLALLIGQAAADPHHFPVGLEQFRLVVERIHVRRAAVGETRR